jgi:hypothetical protein
MFRVFSNKELETIFDWIGTLRPDNRAAVQPEPVDAAPDAGVTIAPGLAEPEPALSFGEVRRRTGMGSVH